MRIALEVKNKWSIVDGSIIAPTNSQPEFPVWRSCNLMVCSWIFKALHPSIVQSIMHMDKAKDVWEDLLRRFSQRDPHRISALQSQIYTLRQGNMCINEYYTKCKTLWEEMNDLRPLTICKCNPSCECDFIDTIREERQVDQVIRFLQGLSDEYSSLRSRVLVMDPLPEVYKVFVMAEKLERQLNLEKLNLNSLETRHSIEKCYKKHGYPPGWIPGYKSKNKQNTFAAAVDTGSTTNVDSMANLGITAEQMQKFIALFQFQITQ
ncbi:PREDICTED: uncharacterized protein LOC109153757 [Ipomoea nil]|uniref:uncharacterized protein LOC109153757 n=1 Tax=Ipomoea nil TaxID=35883 RepID=UPI000901C614|nr:PREDICTED: uncharacterized protein LOC109153757 [Ipomoea nil]